MESDILLPGLVRLYNRLPYDIDFQYNSRQYRLPSHAVVVAPVELAGQAIKQSLYKITLDGDFLFGVVAEGFAPFEPLAEADIKTGDPVKDDTMEFEEGTWALPIKVAQGALTAHRALDRKMTFYPSGRQGD